MNLSEFKTLLGANPAAQLVIALPRGGTVPRHFPVTEVGHVAKRFVDCGGTFRTSESCVLQTWTGAEQDDGHRLTAGKLASILGLARSLLPSDELPVEIEFEDGVVAQFPVEAITGNAAELTLSLGFKHTDCLAKELCGVPGGESEDSGGCCGSGAGAKSCCQS